MFFSLSAGKRGLYLLPCFPLLALLCADALLALLSARARPPRALAFAFGAAGLALAGLGLWAFGQGEIAGARLPTSFPAALVGIPLLGAVGWWRCVRSERIPALAAVLVACAYGLLGSVFWLLYPALDPIRSMKLVAEAARRWTPADQPLALVGSRPMIGGLAYYAARPVEWLDDVEDVPAYFRTGGTTLILKERKLEDLQALAPVRVRERLREGDRALLIVQRRDPPASPSEEPPGKP